MQFFENLGEQIDKAWSAAGYAERALPEIAEQVLLAAECHKHVDMEKIASWLMSATSIPAQGDLSAAFGEPVVIAFSNKRFIIQLLHWVVATTTLHEHGFFGAFCVLEGSSVHSRYQFTPSHVVSEHFQIGQLELKKVELLTLGAVRQITGRKLIHTLFHLGFPSISVVVRTTGHGLEGPQLNYYRPSVGLYPLIRDPVMTRRVQYLKLLATTRPEDHHRWALFLLERADLLSTFLVLQQIAEGTFERAFWDEALAVARRRHEAQTSTFEAVFAHQRRENAIVALRNTITHADHRFFLALLLILPTRDAILDVIRQRFPDADPRHKAIEWVSALGEELVMGVELDELNREILRLLLLGLEDKAILTALAETFSQEDVDSRSQELLRHFGQLRAHPILAPLIQVG